MWINDQSFKKIDIGGIKQLNNGLESGIKRC